MKIRLLADGVVDRWTREKRRQYSESRNELVTSGLMPYPAGIGLSDTIPKAEEN